MEQGTPRFCLDTPVVLFYLHQRRDDYWISKKYKRYSSQETTKQRTQLHDLSYCGFLLWMCVNISLQFERIKRYLHISISSGLTCFSQTCTLSFFICSLKSWSFSRVFVTSPSHSLRYFRWASSFAAGSLKIPNPFDRLHDPQPRTEQLAPGTLINSLHTIFLLNYFKITRKTRTNSRKLEQKLLSARYFDILCTFAVTWHAINQTKSLPSEVRPLSLPVSLH